MAFFRKRKAIFSDENGHEHEISWSFSVRKAKPLPLNLVQCSIKGFGYSSTGFGDGFLLKSAMIRSFAEAWEWLWAKRLSFEQPQNRISSSNGFAAAETDDLAIRRSQEELKERALLLTAWSWKHGWKRISCEGVFNNLIKLWLEGKGYSVDLFKLGDGNDDVIVAIAKHSKLGAVVDSAYRFETRRSIYKVLRNLLRQALLRKRSPLTDLPFDGSPSEHAQFYQNPNHLRAFQFLDDNPTENHSLDLPRGEIRSSVVASSCDFPAVAMSSHDQWPQLKWGTSSIRGVNEWPHPLA